MSLRIRLNLLITLLFISLFICSSYYIIANARSTVHREVESTARLALELIQIAIATTSKEGGEDQQLELLERLVKLDGIQELHIEIHKSNDISVSLEEGDNSEYSNAPAWFVKLVQPSSAGGVRWLYSPAVPETGIEIRADPVDEINENWTEVRGILIFLLIFIILANVLLYIAIGRYLAPIDSILVGLSGIEKGNYHLELPRFRLPELDRISQRFNHMAKVLSKSKAENQLLTQKSLEIQEEERRHLAQELHDELGQTITAIKAVAVAIMNDQKLDVEQVDASVKTIVSYSDHIYNVAKNMMHRLRPSVLDDFGLIKALQNMIDDWNSRQDDMFCHFSFSDIPSDLSDSLKINLFRIIQESLTNALKHSSATEIEVAMNKIRTDNKDQLHLLIKDNGIGLDKDNIMPGMGLLGMKERVEMHGGQFELISEVKNGLTIDIIISMTG